MEYIKVFIVNWLPAAVAGLSVKNPDEGYTILINACLNAEKQYQAYQPPARLPHDVHAGDTPSRSLAAFLRYT